MNIKACLILLVCLVGCIHNGPPAKPTPPPPEPIPVEPPKQEVVHHAIVGVLVPQPLIDLGRTYLGNENTITLTDAIHLDLGDKKADFQAGTNLTYKFTDFLGSFVFNEPYPIAEITELGFKIHPLIRGIELHPDNVAYLTGDWHGIKKTIKFDLNDLLNGKESKTKYGEVVPEIILPTPIQKPTPLEPIPDSEPKLGPVIPLEPIPEPVKPKPIASSPTPIDPPKFTPERIMDSRPIIWLFVIKGEDITNIALEQIRARDSTLPFQVICKDTIPDYLRSQITLRPSAYWSVNTPNITSKSDCRMLYGWRGVDTLLEEWTASKKQAKIRIRFGNPWYEDGHSTSYQHLREHGVPEWVIQKYWNDQSALDKIHGAMHEYGTCFYP